MTMLFGVEVERAVAKATGSRVPGRQDRMLSPSYRRQAIATALSNVSRQQAMALQPDPTLGAPFSSFPDNRLTVAQMGPGEPAENFPLGGEPRQWVYRVGRNFPTTPDTDRGISGGLLRMLADASWLVRRCIEIRKHELCALDWDIVPRGQSAQERRANAVKHESLIKHLREFFRYPESYFSFETDDEAYSHYSTDDGRRGLVEKGAWTRRGLVGWQEWLNACLEDYFVGDWLSLWPQRTLGNEMLGLRRVDGATIKALIDLDGRIPPPPMPAWQQYLYGVPRASWSSDEFYFLPRDVRNTTVFGYSPVQQSLIMCNLALKFDQWNVAAYTESTIPMGLLETPQGYTADQISAVADFLNGAVADLAARQRVYPVPFGTKWQAIKPFDFNAEFAYFLVEATAGCLDVQSQELGIVRQTGGLGSKGHAEMQETVRRRKSFVPTARWVESWMTRIIGEQWRQQGGADLEFRFPDLVHDEQQAKVEALKVAIMTGQKSLDEVCEEQGEPGPGYGRLFESAQGLLFLDKGMALTANGMVPLRLPQPGEPSIFGPHEPPRDGGDAPAPEGGDGPPKATKAVRTDDLKAHGGAPTQRVHDYLAENYPADTLDWVRGCDWHYEPAYPLSRIDMGRRPGGRNLRKVERIEEAIRGGEPMDPVVLVERKGGAEIADGYHRTLAFRHAERDAIPAFVAHGAPEHGPWEREMHDRKLNAATKAVAGETPEEERRRKLEEAFVLAWLLFWRDKLREAGETEPNRPEMAERALEITRDEELGLARVLQDALRAPAYAYAWAKLQLDSGMRQTEPSRSDAYRLDYASQAHAGKITETYHTDLDAQFQQLLSETQLESDESVRAKTILAKLVEWAHHRAQWKAQQVAATEMTDAESQAARDFATQNPRELSMFRWRAVMDDQTCAVCRSLDGQIVSATGPHPPAHPNCRCQLDPVAPNEGAP